MNKTKIYKKIFDELKTLINQIDPYSLIKEGAPKDEFDQEVARILTGLPKCSSSEDVEKLITGVFSDQFGEDFSPKFFSSIIDKVFALKNKLNFTGIGSKQ